LSQMDPPQIITHPFFMLLIKCPHNHTEVCLKVYSLTFFD
jgi:hypothetical protein